jgi:phosphoribosylamine---glycine ligase
VKILVVGAGGREHALAWKIAQSPQVQAVYAAPGNPGIAQVARCVPIAVDRTDDLGRFAEREGIDLVVVGPEAPLVAGLADGLRERGLAVFGPGARAAAIEGSKAFAKALMHEHGVPTARFATFTDPRAARAYGRELGAPLVVKASGLAAGKGAIICRTLAEADDAVTECMERRAFGAAGDTVVVEEFLEGEELSFFALCNGTEVMSVGAAQDHKTVFDDDRGPNTGGMGAYAPVRVLDEAMERTILDAIVRPTIAALAGQGAPYHGVLFAGLMLTKEGPKVVEFNCRFGDPEAQVILPLLAGGLAECMASVARGQAPTPLSLEPALFAVTTVLAARGYPEVPVKGAEIVIPEALPPEVTVFHAGTVRDEDGTLRVAGGRVLNVTAVASSFEEAQAKSREASEAIHFDGKVFRRDIGWREAARLTSRV